MAIKFYVDIPSRYEEGNKVGINGGRKGEYRMYCTVPGVIQQCTERSITEERLQV